MPYIDRKKALLIINPTAGKMKSKAGVFDIIQLFREEDYICTVFTTAKKGDATAITLQYANDYDLVVCCGGDGTLNEIITGLMQCGSRTPIGYIPAGTTNDMAATLELPKGIKKSTQTVLTGEPVAHDIGLFNNQLYFSYVASFGAFTKVAYATPQWMKNRFGRFAYFIDGIKSVGDIHPYRLKVTTDSLELEDDFVFGSITNSVSVAGLFHLDRRDVCLNDGKFEVTLVKNPHNPIELRNTLYGLAHQKYDARYVVFFHTNEISFSFAKDAAWTVDGEFAGSARKIHIENLHDAVRIVQRNTQKDEMQ